MKRTYAVAIACILLAILLMVYGFASPQTNGNTAKPVYALVLPEDIGTTVLQLRQGAQTAAAEQEVELRLFIAEQSSAAGPQLSSFLQSIEALKVDAMILGECEGAILDEAARIAGAQGIPLVTLWDHQSDASTLVVASNDGAQGRLLWEAYLDAGEAAASVHVFTDTGARSAARLAGFVAAAGGGKAVVHEVASGTDVKALADSLPPQSAVFALTAELTQALAQAGQGRFSLWGMDTGDTRLSLLQNGWVRGLLMEMPYAQGYQAVSAAAAQAGNTLQDALMESPSRVVTKETMYDSENVKLVFPLLQ